MHVRLHISLIVLCVKLFSKEYDNQTGDETNNKKTSPDNDHGENGRHPPGLNIVVFHNKRVVVIPPGICLYGTFSTTDTPAFHTSALSVLTNFCCTPRLKNFLSNDKVVRSNNDFFHWGFPTPTSSLSNVLHLSNIW